MAFADFKTLPLIFGGAPFMAAMKSLFALAERRRFGSNSPPGASKCVRVMMAGDSLVTVQSAYPSGNFVATAMNAVFASLLGGTTESAIINFNSASNPAPWGGTNGWDPSVLSITPPTTWPEAYQTRNLVPHHLSGYTAGGAPNTAQFACTLNLATEYAQRFIQEIGGAGRNVPMLILDPASVQLKVITVSDPTYNDVEVHWVPQDDPFVSFAGAAFQTLTFSNPDMNLTNFPGNGFIVRENTLTLNRNSLLCGNARVHGVGGLAGTPDGTGAVCWGCRWVNGVASHGMVVNVNAKPGDMASAVPLLAPNSGPAIAVIGGDLLIMFFGANEANQGVDATAFANSCKTTLAFYRTALGNPSLPCLFINSPGLVGWDSTKQGYFDTYPDALRQIVMANDPLTGFANMRLLLLGQGISEASQGWVADATPLVIYPGTPGSYPAGTLFYMPNDVTPWVPGTPCPYRVFVAKYTVDTNFMNPLGQYAPWYEEKSFYRVPAGNAAGDRIHWSEPGQAHFGSSLAKLMYHTFGSGSSSQVLAGAGGAGGDAVPDWFPLY